MIFALRLEDQAFFFFFFFFLFPFLLAGLVELYPPVHG